MALLRAKQSFLVSPRRIIRTGDLVDTGDPIVRGREALFVPVEDAPTNKPRAAAGAADKPAKQASKTPAKRAAKATTAATPAKADG